MDKDTIRLQETTITFGKNNYSSFFYSTKGGDYNQVKCRINHMAWNKGKDTSSQGSHGGNMEKYHSDAYGDAI